MYARARALAPTFFAADERKVFRYWGPTLLAICLASWLATIGAGQLIIEQF